MTDLKKLALDHVDSVLKTCEELRKLAKSGDYGGKSVPDEARYSAITRARAAILRVAGAASIYQKQAEVHHDGTGHPGYVLQQLVGILRGLRDDLTNDFTTRFSDVLHAEVFADYLEMAEHLLDEGYKDAAAVLGGGTLEAHLRQLCVKNSIATTRPAAKGPEPKKAEAMNQDLGSMAVYAMLDQKNVTAWLDLRNKAAHGKYAEYTKLQVGNMLSGVRDFITRNPA